jgi:SRSO17 transposase
VHERRSTAGIGGDIEHDYRELKAGLGLDHYEGRTWQGWHHHVTGNAWTPKAVRLGVSTVPVSCR